MMSNQKMITVRIKFFNKDTDSWEFCGTVVEETKDIVVEQRFDANLHERQQKFFRRVAKAEAMGAPLHEDCRCPCHDKSNRMMHCIPCCY